MQGSGGCQSVAPGVMWTREGKAGRRLRWGAGLDRQAEERVLQSSQHTFELDDIEAFILACEAALELIGELRVIQEPSVGCLGLIIAASELACAPDLLFELHDRLEEVGVEP